MLLLEWVSSIYKPCRNGERVLSRCVKNPPTEESKMKIVITPTKEKLVRFNDVRLRALTERR